MPFCSGLPNRSDKNWIADTMESILCSTDDCKTATSGLLETSATRYDDVLCASLLETALGRDFVLGDTVFLRRLWTLVSRFQSWVSIELLLPDLSAISLKQACPSTDQEPKFVSQNADGSESMQSLKRIPEPFGCKGVWGTEQKPRQTEPINKEPCGW